ncbi:hypothetical protein ACGFIV_32515 [Sphaerisporangium sp. NPDC049003]|uniref:hypothetical protein n=1 Tax=unclassified Sphaerisporangium TaxID=2630420 RepID=UPI00343DA48F
MTEMSSETRKILREAIAQAHLSDRHDVDTGPLARLEEMPEDEAVKAVDEVFRQIHFD